MHLGGSSLVQGSAADFSCIQLDAARAFLSLFGIDGGDFLFLIHYCETLGACKLIQATSGRRKATAGGAKPRTSSWRTIRYFGTLSCCFLLQTSLKVYHMADKTRFDNKGAIEYSKHVHCISNCRLCYSKCFCIQYMNPNAYACMHVLFASTTILRICSFRLHGQWHEWAPKTQNG